MAVVTTNLGVITAYGDAVAAGYRGTKAEWQALMANYATVGQQAAQDAQTASQAAQTATTKAGEASQSATRAEAAAASITTPDTTLTQAGVAADAKATGDEIADLREGLEDIIATAYVTESANGSVAHFTDGADNIPMKSVRIDTDATSGKVTRCGKNWLKLISESGYTTEKYGIVFTLNDDGSWTLRGTSTRAITHTFANKNSFSLKAGRYKLSGGISNDVIIRINVKDVVYTSRGSDVEFEYADGDFDGASAWGNVYVRVEANVTLDVTIYPMIRLASESDSYEPYKGDTYDVTITDGVVQEEITSLLGINNVWSDSGDIECEYRADTKLYIDKRLGV